MRIIKGSDLYAAAKKMVELEQFAKGPVRRLTIHSEVIFGGIRLDPGTYEVRRVSPKPEDEQF